MRCLSGTSWGANKTTLLHIYKATVRSILDYGSAAYDSANPNVKDKLNKIQAQALRIICGAIKSTSTASLQNECGEMPLQLRRNEIALKYSLKIRNEADHPAKAIIKPSSKNCKKKQYTFHKQTREFLQSIPTGNQTKQTQNHPPWKNKVPKICTFLHDILKIKNINKEQRVEIIEEHETHSHTPKYICYIDGSKREDGRSGAAFIFNDGTERNYRLSENASSTVAEYTALYQALLELSVRKNVISATIYTDSLELITNIQERESANYPNQMMKILNVMDEIQNEGNELEFCWIPSHSNIQGNERADKLAKEATERTEIELIIQNEIKDLKRQAELYTIEKWQQIWDKGKTGREYYKMEPIVTTKLKYASKTREQDKIITRFRLRNCRLNAYLYRMKKHPDGLCDICQTPETVDHFLTKCNRNQSLIIKLNRLCQNKYIPFETDYILTNTDLCDTVFEFIKSQKRKI
jgi:ribonuclease HI